jgi:hypothetical protein
MKIYLIGAYILFKNPVSPFDCPITIRTTTRCEPQISLITQFPITVGSTPYIKALLAKQSNLHVERQIIPPCHNLTKSSIKTKMNETTTKQMMMVHFNDDELSETFLLDDSLSTPVQPNTLWYSAEEYELFRTEFRTDAPCETKETSCRRQFVQNLLSQQREHKEIGISDPKGLQMLSKVCSKGARLKARELAAKNEQDVADFLERRKVTPPKSPTRYRRARNSVAAVTA